MDKDPNQSGLPADILSILQRPSCRLSLSATQSSLSCARRGELHASLYEELRR
jgi:hypothetical protein